MPSLKISRTADVYLPQQIVGAGDDDNLYSLANAVQPDRCGDPDQLSRQYSAVDTSNSDE
jgi:hypothetical protein